MSNRPLNNCHFAHRRSTLAWSRKKSGSLAAVGMLERNPLKLVCAKPCGSPSSPRNCSNRSPGSPRARVSASLITNAPLVWVLNCGRLTMWNSVGCPELQWVVRGELHRRRRGVRNSHEGTGEELRSRRVESPVRQGHARVDGLELSLEIEQKGPVPRQEPRQEVRLGASRLRVDVAEVAEPPHPAVVEGGQRRQEAVTLRGRQVVRVLSDADHQRGARQDLRAAGIDHLDRGVSVSAARLAELS